MDPLHFVIAKIKNAGVKTVSIVTECEKIDRNKDGRIHSDDLAFIIGDLMASDPLTRREMRHLLVAVANNADAGDVEIDKLYTVLDAPKKTPEEDEKWFDGTGSLTNSLKVSSSLRFSSRTLNLETMSPGRLSSSNQNNQNVDPNRENREYAPRDSIGSWLEKSACPAEVKNFKKFIHALEKYERDSGMHIEDQPNGFTVPLGPDLKVSMTFRID